MPPAIYALRVVVGDEPCEYVGTPAEVLSIMAEYEGMPVASFEVLPRPQEANR